MNIDWHIGDVITKLRKRRRMNQTAMAQKVGVSKATIVRAEDGDPKVSRATYINIARVLGIDLAALEVEAARLGNANRQSDDSTSHTAPAADAKFSENNDGESLAFTEAARGRRGQVPSAAHRLSAELEAATQEEERREARAVRKHDAAPRPRAAGGRARHPKSRR